MILEENAKAEKILEKDFVEIDIGLTVGEALEKFKNHEFNSNRSIYYVFVTDSDEFKGIVSVKELLENDREKPLSEVYNDDVIEIDRDKQLEDVARLMSKYDFQALPVVENKKLIGIVRLDEMLEVLDEAATEDIFRKAGILNLSKEEANRSDAVLNSTIFNEIKIRLPWLLFALVGGFIAAQVIEGFEKQIMTTATLAFFLPLIMDMGGNVGTQSSTIFVRGVVLGQISGKDVRHRLLKETFAGGAIGIITGVLAAGAAYVVYGEPVVSAILVSSMTVICMFASLIGFIIPWLAYKLGRDPAAVSDPIITTIKDITALLVYFGFAALLLGI